MAPRLKQLIVEIHRRSLWQVLVIYLGASWAVLEASDQVIGRYLLPEWVYPTEILILLVTFPIVLATALVREEAPPEAGVPVGSELRDPTLLGDTQPTPAAAKPGPLTRFFTWRKTLLWVLFAFGALAVLSASVVMGGAGRVTEARGEAGEAFAERAWLLIADPQALAEEADIALAAQAALRTDLQQSGYVNVFSWTQLRPVLRRMMLPDSVPLTEGLALEIAEREGLSAVLGLQVNRLRGDYILVARVTAPGSGAEIINIRTAARSDRLLDGVETLSRELRSRLGEQRGAIGASKPLPEVTTGSLGALRAYAEADRANTLGERERAAGLLAEAIRLDSTFAMAHRLASVMRLGSVSESASEARRAFELRDRLTDRERLHVEAVYYNRVEWDIRQAAAAYESLLARYPDDTRALNNLAGMATLLGDRERAYRGYRRAIELEPYNAISYSNAIGSAFLTDRWEAADTLIALAERHGLDAEAARWRRDRAAVRGDWERADQLCDSLLAAAESQMSLAGEQSVCGALDIARGRIRRGIERLESSARYRAAAEQYVPFMTHVGEIALAEQIRGRPGAAQARIEALLNRFPADSIPLADRFVVQSGLRWGAAQLGQLDLAGRIRQAYPLPEPMPRIQRHGQLVAGAAEALARGDAARAAELMREARGYDAAFTPFRYLVDLVSGMAFEALSEPDSAIAYLERAAHPGHMAGWTPARVLRPVLERRLAELEEERGNADAAVRHYRRFLELWSDADPELRDQVTSARRALARLTGSEAS